MLLNFKMNSPWHMANASAGVKFDEMTFHGYMCHGVQMVTTLICFQKVPCLKDGVRSPEETSNLSGFSLCRTNENVGKVFVHDQRSSSASH